MSKPTKSEAETRTESELIAYRLKYIKQYIAAGYTLFPLVKNKKIPAVKAWQHVKIGEFTADYLSQSNYGVALKGSDFVIDYDPRNALPGATTPPLHQLQSDLVFEIPVNTFTVATGGGGLHIYMAKSPGVENIAKSLQKYPGLDFLAGPSRFVVGPGSIHPGTGKRYECLAGADYMDFLGGGVADAPAALINLVKKGYGGASGREKISEGFEATTDTNDMFVAYLATGAPLAKEGEHGDEVTYKVACIGRDLGLSSDTVYEVMRDNWNDSCTPRWTDSELQDKVRNAYKYASGAPGAKNPINDFKGVPATTPDTNGKDAEKSHWRTDQYGRPRKTLYNLLNFLRIPQYGYSQLFGLNEFTKRIEFRNPAPWHNGKMPTIHGIHDQDVILLKSYLSKNQDFEVFTIMVQEAITIIAHENCFHPVREYLDGLTWDGVPRLDTWLRDYATIEDNTYTRAVARKVLCAAVARIYTPGIKFDHVLVLEGAQKLGKSTLCAKLGGAWYGDFVMDPHSKDTIDKLQGKWIVEMAEMEVSSRSDVNALKAFITRQVDRDRLAYERLTADFPRQCIFIGTINPDADGGYLKDSTGNRRFWPVKVRGKIDFKGIKQVRDQLFAEAKAMLAKGEKLYMETEELDKAAEVEAAERHGEDPWTHRVKTWLSMAENQKRNFLTSRDIFIEALGGTDLRLGRRETTAIANVMRSIGGWDKSIEHVPGVGATRGYSRVGGLTPSEELKAHRRELESSTAELEKAGIW